MEVAGLVLGVFPIAIKTLQQYKTILSSYKNAVQRLGTLETALEGELKIFECTCETLLDGIVPSSQVEIMLKDPFGPEWKNKEFNKKLRLRLQDSCHSVEMGMKELRTLVDQLKAKLGIGQDLKSELTTIDAIQREIQKRTASTLARFEKKIAFTLDHKEYEALLAEIKSVNLRLYTLVNNNKTLEPSRRYRSQWRFTNLLRDLSGSLFKALDGATVRCCASPHDVCLRLSLRDLEMEAGSVNNQVAKELDFHVALGLYNNTATSGYPTQIPSEWYNLLIRIAEGTSEESGKQGSQPEPQSFRQRLIKRTRATRALIGESLKLILKPKTELMSMAQLPSGLGLCQMIRAQQMSPTTANDRVLYGFIQDREIQRLFGLYAPVLQQSGNDFALRQMLQQSSGVHSRDVAYPGVVLLGFQGKLQLAVLVAINVMHLYNTPWLSKTITLDDIKFRLGNDASTTLSPRFSSVPEFGPRFLYRPFISKVMPSSSPPTMLEPSDLSRTRPWEMTALSFGLILIQIMLERVIDELGVNAEQNASMMTFQECEAKCNTGRRYESEVLQEAGPEYASAVMWCLGSFVSIGGLHNEKFCQEFCDKVISKLQEALDKSR